MPALETDFVFKAVRFENHKIRMEENMKKEYLVSAQEMAQYDLNTIEKTKIPALVLMERAALSVAECAKNFLQNHPGMNKVLVLAGNGNNGADAVAAGRILKEYGYEVSAYLIPTKNAWNENLLLQVQIAKTNGVVMITEPDMQQYTMIIDGIFGNGLNRDIQGEASTIIEQCNLSGKYVLSVDVPSGICATDGKVKGIAIKADETVTFGFFKRGLFLYPGKEYAGKCHLAVMGINQNSFYGTKPKTFTYYDNEENSEKIDLQRKCDGNKGTFGKVLIVAGRKNTTGAAILAANSAQRSGCGMTALFTDLENKEVLMNVLPETMVHCPQKEQEKTISNELRKIADWADVIAVGPGLSTDDYAKKVVETLLFETNKPLILDADAINILAHDKTMQARLSESRKNEQSKRILFMTPHPLELARLLGVSVEEIRKNRIEILREASKRYRAIIVSKDADTIICDAQENLYINSTGNDALATAGTGDVLTGLLASIVAQYLKKETIPYEDESSAKNKYFYASCMAVYLHGKAGDSVSKNCGNGYVTAGDLIKQYPYILK